MMLGMANASSTTAAPTVERPQRVPAGRAIITANGERALRAELARLRHQHEHEFAERLREAREFGEGANNDEMLQIREEEAVVEARIARISALLANATVVEEAGGSADVVAIGAEVVVEDRDSGKRSEYLITGGHEPLSPNTASVDSPVGRALLGSRVGDDVDVELPRGKVRKLRVVSVTHL